MNLLTKREYLDLIVDDPKEVKPPTKLAATVIETMDDLWEPLQLKKRKLKPASLPLALQHRSRILFHIKAFPRKQPGVVVVVITKGGRIEGHILLDLSAEDRIPQMYVPQQDFEGEVDAVDATNLLASLDPNEDDPFAVLETGDGTYMQTYNENGKFWVEYQLVNTSSHYQIRRPTTLKKVTDAMVSFGFGDNEWLKLLKWHKQDLEEA